jgi:hypothetical protein
VGPKKSRTTWRAKNSRAEKAKQEALTPPRNIIKYTKCIKNHQKTHPARPQPKPVDIMVKTPAEARFTIFGDET